MGFRVVSMCSVFYYVVGGRGGKGPKEAGEWPKRVPHDSERPSLPEFPFSLPLFLGSLLYSSLFVSFPVLSFRFSFLEPLRLYHLSFLGIEIEVLPREKQLIS